MTGLCVLVGVLGEHWCLVDADALLEEGRPQVALDGTVWSVGGVQATVPILTEETMLNLQTESGRLDVQWPAQLGALLYKVH